jgi:AraC-like DNA-binding protein
MPVRSLGLWDLGSLDRGRWGVRLFDDLQTYLPRSLGGIVDVIAEARIGDTSKRAWIMPNGSIEIAFFLDGSRVDGFYMGSDADSERGSRNSFSLLFGAQTRPQVVMARETDVVLVMMSPIAAKLLFGIPASEVHNRTIEPNMIQGDLAMIEDELNTLPSFRERAQFLEGYLLRRLRAQSEIPPFVSFTRHGYHALRDADPFWMSKTLIDKSGYSSVHMNRLAKIWLGTTLNRYEALFRFRNALDRMQAPDVNLAQVAAECGYHDQAHFTHSFKEYSGLTPSAYRAASKVGIDTLFFEELPASSPLDRTG